MDHLLKQETSRKIKWQETRTIGNMKDAHENHNKSPHYRAYLGHFKVADILKVSCCVKEEASTFLSPVTFFFISTLCVTDVKLKLEYGSVLPQKSSMCPTDASFRWLNSVCWMWSMEDVKKKVGRQNFTVLSCVYTARFIDFFHMPVAWLRFSTP